MQDLNHNIPLLAKLSKLNESENETLAMAPAVLKIPRKCCG